MMVASRIFMSRFTNRYGERWVFVYDPATGEGILRGSDVDWEEYRVIQGKVDWLILNDEEIRWLRRSWAAAIIRTQP